MSHGEFANCPAQRGELAHLSDTGPGKRGLPPAPTSEKCLYAQKKVPENRPMAAATQAAGNHGDKPCLPGIPEPHTQVARRKK